MSFLTDDLGGVAREISRSLSHGTVIGRSAYITTSASYANGRRIVVRIDQHGPDDFFVSDDGGGASEAEMMGGLPAFHRAATRVAEQSGVSFDQHSFYALKVSRSQIVGAVVSVANATQRSVERTIFTLEERRVVQSREIFIERIRDAFGRRAVFDINLPGRSGREWRMDAGVESDGRFVRTFALVRPSTIGVATAHLKCSDIRLLPKPPLVIAALADYGRTPPDLRLLLSDATDAVIAANDDRTVYTQAA